MQVADLVDVLQTRAERLGLVREDGHADAAELELYLWQGLLDLIEQVDIPAYLEFNQRLVVTTPTLQAYPLPPDFGRLILPRVQNKRGVYLDNGTTTADLEYMDGNAFARQRHYASGRPTQFTVIGRRLWLAPPPDANNGNHYTIQGLYVVRVARPALEDDVLLAYPAVLIDQALYRLSTDMKLDVPALVQSRADGLVRLTQGSR